MEHSEVSSLLLKLNSIWSQCFDRIWLVRHLEKHGSTERNCLEFAKHCVGGDSVWFFERKNIIFNTLQSLSATTQNCETNMTVRKTSSAWQHCCPESFWNPETFCNKVNIGPIQKLFGQPRNCPDNLKTVRTILKLFGQPKNCPDNPETVQTT